MVWLLLPIGGFLDNPTGEDLVAAYQGNQAVYFYIPYFVGAIAAVSLVVLATALRSVFIESEGVPGHLTTLFYAPVVVFALAQLFATAAFLAGVATALFNDNPNARLTAGIDATVSNAGLIGLGLGQFLLSLGLVASAIIVLRSRVLGVWFAWLSIAMAVLALLVIPLFIGSLAPVVWALSAAIALITRPKLEP
jgi:hypothetical protein